MTQRSHRFAKATKRDARLRLALCGPSGSGKTFSALRLAAGLGGSIAVIDTERGSASKYADDFEFSTLHLTDHSPRAYVQALRDAEAEGFSVIIIDSLSHAWMGNGGALEMVDKAAAKSKSSNTFAAWRFVTPEHNALVDAMLASHCHVIATMRTKTEWILEENDRGKKEPRKIGTAPIQRDGVEYEFDVVGELRLDNTMVVAKTRFSALNGEVISPVTEELGRRFADWLSTKPQTERRPVPSPVGQPPGRRDEDSAQHDEPPPQTEPPYGEPPSEAPDLPPTDPQVGRLAREGLLVRLRDLVRIVGAGAAAELLHRDLRTLRDLSFDDLEAAAKALEEKVAEVEAAQRLVEEQREQAAAEAQRRLDAAMAKTTEHKEKVDFEARAAAMAAKARGA